MLLMVLVSAPAGDVFGLGRSPTVLLDSGSTPLVESLTTAHTKDTSDCHRSDIGFCWGEE
jgi:hypothetical protein